MDFDAAGSGAAADPYAGTPAAFYDLGLQGFDDDIGLYLEFGRRGRGRVLELGCGTGRVSCELAKVGLDVAGVDRSPDMLRQALGRAGCVGAGPKLVLADITAVPLVGPFDLVFVALDGFLHLTDRSMQSALLAEARRLLGPRGVLVLDLSGPAALGWEDWSPGLRPLVQVWSRPGFDGLRVTKFSSFTVDASTQCHHISEIYELTGLDGSTRRWYAEYSLRFVFPAELELLLAACGLRLAGRYGSYDLEPFDAASMRQICVAGRAGRRGSARERSAC